MHEFNVGDIVKFESMHLFGLVVDLRGRLIIVRWFDDEDGESQSIGSYSARDLIKVS